MLASSISGDRLLLGWQTPSSSCVLPWWREEALVSLHLLIRVLIPSWGLYSHDLI